MKKKGPESEIVQRPTKTTVMVPPDLYGELWQLIATARGAGQKKTAQDVIIEALREHLAAKQKEAAA